ncbi:MAG: hypothetical protein IPJ27_00635 [Candidatus Accumulibacter sp.]|uniref:Toprim domain-containing protein n=1 Tax=Candidatus Accumulibacter proximus TaxID=2954385 RepID=A0A935PVB1_9PROT|nr:hypothetical protein [Candidatus Accumulibacter proximus]
MKSFTQTPVLASAALNSTDGEAAVADPRLDPINPHEQAARLARIEEERVRRDPKSTDEDIAAAREARKSADVAALLNDKDLQRQIAEHEREQQTTQAGQVDQASQFSKIWIDVPYPQKDEAKALGARWDRQEQSWYVPAGVDPAPFARWTPTTVPQALPKQSPATPPRQYLAVPYGERVAAKAAGAVWDKAAKSWYAGPKADMATLKHWKPDKVPAQQGPAMTPRDEFAEALRSIGCVVSGEHPIMDGQNHRISVEGEKHSEKAGSGFYVGHRDGHRAGYIKNNKTGIDLKWKSKGYTFEPEQKARMLAEAAEKLQARTAEQERLHEQTAQRVARQMTKLLPVIEPTAYMKPEGIEPQPGVFTEREVQKTYIPATEVDDKQWTMQYIREDGTKRFAKDSRKEVCFHVVGGLDALAKAPVLVIGESYATAGSLSQTLGFAMVAAFDSGKLVPVAKALHEKYPDKPIVIAGEDDKHLETTQGVNPGRSKAEEAARAVGGKLLLPIFVPGEHAANSYRTLAPGRCLATSRRTCASAVHGRPKDPSKLPFAQTPTRSSITNFKPPISTEIHAAAHSRAHFLVSGSCSSQKQSGFNWAQRLHRSLKFLGNCNQFPDQRLVFFIFAIVESTVTLLVAVVQETPLGCR